jgi:hypothetical protein
VLRSFFPAGRGPDLRVMEPGSCRLAPATGAHLYLDDMPILAAWLRPIGHLVHDSVTTCTRQAGGFMAVDDHGRVVPFETVRYLNPADQVLEDMFTGWRRQQLARNLSPNTINSREQLVRRFLTYTNEMP